MPKAIFICDIFNENGEKTQSEFVFDDITTDTAQEIDKYIIDNDYVLNEICGYWGNDYGILTEIVRDEE